MSSATSTDFRLKADAAERSKKAEATAQGEQADDAGFRPWHFFILAALVASTIAVLMSRQSTPEHLILISLTIAAVVTAVLPNGNLMIQGSQEVRTNTDLRQLTVAGIVRPEDISSANTIRHTQIAEARISYGGRGDISRVQKTPAGQSLIEKFSPF